MRIGPLGRMIEVRSPQAMPSEVDRPSTQVTLVNGQRIAYRSPRSAREWAWEIPYGTDDDIEPLLVLEQGALGPPPWRWYDPMAAATNMLPDVIAAAGTGPAAWRWFGPDLFSAEVGGPVTLHNGYRFAQSLMPARTLTFPYRQGAPDPVPVIPGRAYTFSMHLFDDADGTLSMLWVDEDSELVDEVVEPLEVGRMVLSGEAPENAAGVLFQWAAGTPTSVADVRAGHIATETVPAFDITGDIDLRCYCGLDRWPAGVDQDLINKYQTAANGLSYRFFISPEGRPGLQWTEDGTADTVRRVVASTHVPVVDGELVRLRATLDVDNGSGGHTATFYWSADADTPWQTLGGVQTFTGTSQIHNGGSNVRVSMGAGGSQSTARGQVLSAEFWDGIEGQGGSRVAFPDFSPDGPWEPADGASDSPRDDAHGIPWSLTLQAFILGATIPQTGRRMSGLQLTETPEAVPWKAGMGIPWVFVSGLDNLTYARVTPADKYRSIDLTLLEVV